jgi:hypothetical protein
VAWSNDSARFGVLEGSKADGHRPSLPDFFSARRLQDGGRVGSRRQEAEAGGRHGRKVAEIQAARRRPGRKDLFMTS